MSIITTDTFEDQLQYVRDKRLVLSSLHKIYVKYVASLWTIELWSEIQKLMAFHTGFNFFFLFAYIKTWIEKVFVPYNVLVEPLICNRQ